MARNEGVGRDTEQMVVLRKVGEHGRAEVFEVHSSFV